jgi:CRISPR/Cas system-associated exonuclease Cas4 (RecB family)
MITPVTLTANGQPFKRTPNEVAMANTGRPYLTHSEISAYQSCPLRWYYAYVEHAEAERVSAAMLVGTCTHAAIQCRLESILAADTLPTVDQMMDAYRKQWAEEARNFPEIQYARDDNAESLEATARQMVETFLASPFAKPKGEIIGIEETLNIGLADDLPNLCGRVDLMELENNELVITDYKTTRSMWSADTADDHAQQLILYAHAAAPLAKELGAKIKLRFVVLTKAKTPKIEAIPIDINMDRVERTTAVVRRVFKAMQAGVIYPSPSVMNCSSCAYKNRCEKWHRTADLV